MNDILAINTIKVNGVAAINKANSGHPGIVLGAAPMMHTLFSKHLVFDPKNPKWVNRDRFILSAGHGSALLYAQLHLLGLVTTEDLKKFRQLKSKTPGHPEYGHTPGVEATTGPLGQGVAMAVGLAVAEEHLRAKFSEINHKTYALVGDGDLQEGVAMEALSFAGKQKLKNLIVLFDSNDVQLDTDVAKVFNDDIKKRFEAINFKYIRVEKNEVEAIDKAITEAKASDKPTLIEIKTIIGEGAEKQGTSAVHGAPLGDDFKNVKHKLGWKGDEFEIPQEVKDLYENTIFKRGKEAFAKFKTSAELKKFLDAKEPEVLNVKLPKDVATRASSGEMIKYINDKFPNWIGGSADLVGSTKAGGGDGDFEPNNRKGRNILFGVREFAMAAMSNGIALHSNFRPFASTFFVFSDYAKPAIRLSAMMRLPVIYIFTHDSVFVGEDGPTHEPIEHLAMLRSIPNINILRPADETEVVAAYDIALKCHDKPSVIILTRQNITSLAKTDIKAMWKGAYFLRKGNSDWTLVASGSELANAYKLAEEKDLSCVSISNFKGEATWDLDKAISIEAATTFGLSKYARHNIGIDRFGESAPGEEAYKSLKLDYESLKSRIEKIIK